MDKTVVFLFDVDNTLIDNDRVQAHLSEHLEQTYGAATRDRYWEIFEQLRSELGYADYLGALAGFPGWTRHGDDAIAAGELVYEPPRILIRANGRPSARATTNNGIMASPPETREESARATPRVVLPAHDRRGRRPRSASRPRR